MKRRNISPKKRYAVFERDNFTCQYCGRSVTKDNIKLEVDHKIPYSKGGSDEMHNLITSCFDCNRGKRDFLNYSKISIENITPELAYEVLPIIVKMLRGNTEGIKNNKKEYQKQLLKNLDRTMGIFNIRSDKYNTGMPFYKFLDTIEEKYKEYIKNNFTVLSSNESHLHLYKEYYSVKSDTDVAIKLIEGCRIPSKFIKNIIHQDY